MKQALIIPRFADPVTFPVFLRACNALDVPPGMALRDPAWTLRVAASVDVERGQAFIDAVCLPGYRPDLSTLREDVSALTVAVIWIQLVDRMRRQRKATRRIDDTLREAA